MAVKLVLTFVQIMLAARQEARRLKHAYLGVEHVFMALCRLGGFTEGLLHRVGVDPRAVRRAICHAVDNRFVSDDRDGIHYTPRLRSILSALSPAAGKEMTADISEPDLLKAIIKEGDSIPMRVLREMGIDLGAVLTQHEDAVAAATDGTLTQSAKPDSEAYKLLTGFGRDLTQLALDGKLGPVIGREAEIRHLEQTLVRATKSNPLLLGEAGVGKTAIVEGLAYQIAHDKVIPELRGRRIIEINLTQVTAGTKYRGAFEENLVKIIEAARSDPGIILTMDELHTLVGAGGSRGGLDASNILKPALARGELRLIGATTREEYRKYIEPDAALERRFQPITVDEPTPEQTLAILSGIRQRFESHHKVTIEEGALQAAVTLATRFLPSRRMPDKAIDLLDEACAHARVVAATPNPVDATTTLKVGADDVARVLTDWTGLPVNELSREQQQRLADMPARLKQRVIGQDVAVQVVTSAIETAFTGLHSGNRPIAVLLFVGPTGVGKTELAKALAEFLFGSEQEMIRLDMSEYQERHHAAKLIGAPPGYVGYEEAGQLTETLRNKPYSVVLLDEVEKAHPDIFDVFLQLFDDGRLTDAHGRTADASNAIFIMTSNIGSALYDTSHGIGFTSEDDVADHHEEILRECKRFFRPEFINRIDEIVVFQPLGRAELEQIVAKLVDELRSDLDREDIRITLTPDAVAYLAKEGYEPMYGARPLHRTFARLLVQPLAHRIITGQFTAGDEVRISVAGERLVIDKETASA